MRILFLASGAFAQPTLRWLAQSRHEVPLVVTQPARGSGRGKRMTRTPVAALAEELGIEVVQAEDVNDPTFIKNLQALDIRLGVAVAFGQMLRSDLLASLPGGFINLHASLLPKYRGAAPINWAIVRGEERTGCTVFRIERKLDAGPILVSRWTSIKPEETAGELHDRLAGIGVDAVSAALELYEQEDLPAGTPQDHSQATLAPKLLKSDGAIDFDQPAADVANHICGMSPWPGAAARFEGADGRWENVTILRARVAEIAADSTAQAPSSDAASPAAPPEPPGTFDYRRYITTQSGHVEVLEIKPSSSRAMSWQDYVNGRHLAAGDRFIAQKSETPQSP